MFEELLVTELSKKRGFETALAKWTSESESFSFFLSKYKKNIASKIRPITNEEDLWDVFFELEVGYYLALNNSFNVLEYQPRLDSQSKHKRSPDYFVGFGEEKLYLEVKRIRDLEKVNGTNFRPLKDIDIKIKNAIFDKLTQFIPDALNILYVFSESPDLDEFSLENAMEIIKHNLRAKNEDFFSGAKWAEQNTKYFIEKIVNLSAIVLRTTFRDHAVLVNPDAKVKVSNELYTELLTLKPKGELSKEEEIKAYYQRIKNS